MVDAGGGDCRNVERPAGGVRRQCAVGPVHTEFDAAERAATQADRVALPGGRRETVAPVLAGPA
ncbi:hypothetical protein Tco_0632268, partial [Tanacetum coccineum]